MERTENDIDLGVIGPDCEWCVSGVVGHRT